MDHARTVAAARHVLAERLLTPVSLRLTEVVSDFPGSANAVLRCEVEAATADIPASVIVKAAKRNSDHLIHEWTSLDFLNGLTEARELIPTLYGGSEAAKLLVMEDLGASDDQLLGYILDGKKPPKTSSELREFQTSLGYRAAESLLAFQRALGKLHAVSVAKRDGYGRIRQTLSARRTSHHRIHDLEETLGNFAASVEAVQIAWTEQAQSELQQAVHHLHNPGPFLAFTHGDATPANVLVSNGHVRFFDWETGAFRHALLDGSFARLRYLHSVWARRIPRPLQRQMLESYREEFARGCPEASDDAIFNSALISCCAAWLAALCRHLPDVIEHDKKYGRATLRQRIATGVEHFNVLVTETELFPALANVTGQMAQRLQDIWPAEDRMLPPYRAFARVGPS